MGVVLVVVNKLVGGGALDVLCWSEAVGMGWPRLERRMVSILLATVQRLGGIIRGIRWFDG